MRDDRELLTDATDLLTRCLRHLEKENAVQDMARLYLVTEIACFLKEIGVEEEVAKWRDPSEST